MKILLDSGETPTGRTVLVHGGWLWIAGLDNHRICAVPLGR
jgi:hypothetical protein